MDNSISGIGADFSGKNVFVYCGNDPINKIDPDGHSWKDIKSWIEEKWNSVKNTVKKIIKPIYDVYYNATKWHFEERIKKNQNIPSYAVVNKNKTKWKKLSWYESIFHNDWTGKAEEKYVNSDGREAVFDGDTHELITDPRIAGTYNYSSPYSLTENPTIDDYKRYTTSRVKHFV